MGRDVPRRTTLRVCRSSFLGAFAIARDGSLPRGAGPAALTLGPGRTRSARPLAQLRENLKLSEGGEEGRDNDIARETFERTGASIMGKRMFELGEPSWPEEAFHTQVFVLTHERRAPRQRPGGTTFHFVNDGIDSALAQARKAAGERDVRIAGGGATILQYLNAG